jgi:hypothetical protein
MQIAKIDVEVQENGDWIGDIPEMGAVRLKIRGANNKDWRRMQGRLLQAVPRAKKTPHLDPDESDRIVAILLRETALLDWEGITTPDGQPLPFSKEQANEYLTNPEFRDFFDGALWAANNVARQRREEVEALAKN